jgi:hypothetical protein
MSSELSLPLLCTLFILLLFYFLAVLFRSNYPFLLLKWSADRGEGGAWIVATPPTSPIYIVGYNDLNILVFPGRWWLKHLIIRHICKKSFSAFLSRFVRDCIQSLSKVLNQKHFFSQKNNIGIKKMQNLMLNLRIRWKIAKKSCQIIINEKVREKWSFLLILLCAKVVRL